MDFEAYQEKLNKANNAVFHSHRIFCERVLEFKPGERGIITNGKVNLFEYHNISITTAKKILFFQTEWGRFRIILLNWEINYIR